MSLRLDEVAEIRSAAKSLGESDAHHLVSLVYLGRYIRIADRIKQLVTSGQVLDWGCGYGQMTCLLRNRGLSVTPYEVEDRPGRRRIPELSKISIVLGSPAYALPFQDGYFDAVLSCGVLEHVGDFDFAVTEIARVLKPQGLFLIFYLPTAYAYTERVHRLLGRWSHPVLFRKEDVRDLLERHQLKLEHIRICHLLPGLNGFAPSIQRVYELAYPFLRAAEWVFERIPLVNLVCGDWECVARKS